MSLVFVVGPTPVALVGPLSEALWPIEHVESATEAVGERDHSDWLFGLFMSFHDVTHIG